MKLTKDQRFVAYCILLQEAKDWIKHDEYWHNNGICYLVDRTFGIYIYYENCTMPEFGLKNVRSCFPELYSKRTIRGGYWFATDRKGWTKRIQILKQCIAETHP